MKNEIKVFICHSSDDKERFVKEFAKKLLNTGIDVFYDDWCLDYGDSLITLFDKIEEADVFIIIISKNSINSRWVKEELYAGFIRKIEEGTKLIPVIIDNFNDITIPNSLKHIKYCKINNILNYDEEFKELRNFILGMPNKPRIGEKPRFFSIPPINGLTQIDSLIIKQLGNLLYSKPNYFSFEEIINLTEGNFSKEEIFESLQVLEETELINCTYTLSSKYPANIKLEPEGVDLYCSSYESNYDVYKKEIVSSILNNNLKSVDDISVETEVPKFIVLNFIKLLNNKGYLNVIPLLSGNVIINKISGTGKRKLKEILET